MVCHGAPSIAIYAARAALAVGAGTVTFESDDASILAVAESVAAIDALTSFDSRLGRWPIVVDWGQMPAVLQHAIASTEPDGVHTAQRVALRCAPRDRAGTGEAVHPGIQFHIGRVNSAALLPEVAALIGNGRLDPANVTSDVIAWDQAADRYLHPAPKLIVAR